MKQTVKMLQILKHKHLKIDKVNKSCLKRQLHGV